jgi:hypothetical protein
MPIPLAHICSFERLYTLGRHREVPDDAINAALRAAPSRRSGVRENLAFDGYIHGTQQHNFFSRLVRGQRCLLKLHGDADDRVLSRYQAAGE